MAEMSETETTFLDTNIYKGEKYKAIQFLMCVRTSNLLKHFNIRTSLRATHQGSKKASSEQTLLKKYLKSKFKILNHAYEKEVIPRTLIKGPSQKCNLKQETGTPSKSKGEQTNLAFRYAIPPSSAKLQTNPHERQSFKRATAIVQRNLQRPAPHMLQKGAVNKRYTRES